MDYKTWKHQHTVQSLNAETFEQRKKEYNFTIEKESTLVKTINVKGICLTTGCENTYTKIFETIETSSGPFCYECMGRKQPVKHGLLVDEHPLIAESIMEIVNNTKILKIDQLTAGMKVKVKCRCAEKCSRCNKQHEYIVRVDTRVSGRGCPICAYKKHCPCQSTNEFCCSTCKLIKPISQSVGFQNWCKCCCSKRHDGNLKSFVAMLISNIKQRKTKIGDLTQDDILVKYHNQDERCFLSNIPLVIGRYQNWQLSVERVDQSGNYDNSNTTLICLEFQSPHRQWNIDLWDEFCSYVKGAMCDLPDEEDYLNSIVQNIRSKKSSRRSPTDVEKNDVGQTRCKTCSEWLNDEKFSKSMLKIGYCKKCEKEKQRSYENTLMGRIVRLFNRSKKSVINRKGDASIHDIIIQDILTVYLCQKGRCAYSNIPLCFSGVFQMSLERKNVRKGYTKDNICLIVLPLNVCDQTAKKSVDDDRDDFSGWNREKVLWAVDQNPRHIVAKVTTVKEFLSK